VFCSDDVVRAHAPAKINLRLKILAREVSGYHQLEMIFCAVGLADSIEVARAGEGIELEVTGADLGEPRDNLVYRAARAFFDLARIAPGVRIRLHKEIPAGAGLGGGSSDAATTLVALNSLYGEPLQPGALARIGATLGSDVPFFMAGASCALAWGRGERLLPLPAPPTAPILLVVPPFGISTPAAYQMLDEAREGRVEVPVPARLTPDITSSWANVARYAENDFQTPTFNRYPMLRAIKVALQDAGATISMLSGSGSAVFGVFPDERTRETAIPLVRVGAPGARIIETHTPVG